MHSVFTCTLTTRTEESYLKYIIVKLARYSLAPLLLYSLPRYFTHVHYSEKALVAPRLVSAAVAVGFGLQSGSDLVTELRASSDPLLYTVFRAHSATDALPPPSLRGRRKSLCLSVSVSVSVSCLTSCFRATRSQR